MNKILLVLIIICSFFLNSFSQSPYKIDWRKEPLFLGIGGGMLLGGMVLHSTIKPYTEAELLALSRNEVNEFDRNATYNYSLGTGNFSNAFLVGSNLLPTLFLLNKNTKSEFGNIAVLYTESLFISYGFTDLTKKITLRSRPYAFNENAPLDEKLKRQTKYSFFSGHTSVTAANCFFTAKVFSDFFPDSDMLPYVWGAAALAPAVTGYLRVKAGKHYNTDVIAGYTIGALTGFFVPHLHKVQKGKTFEFYPGFGGLSFVWNIR